MSRTYKYPREALDDQIERNEFEAAKRIMERLEEKKRRKKKRIKAARSFKKMISYRDRERARVRG